jgi:hypothetical protein
VEQPSIWKHLLQLVLNAALKPNLTFTSPAATSVVGDGEHKMLEAFCRRLRNDSPYPNYSKLIRTHK